MDKFPESFTRTRLPGVANPSPPGQQDDHLQQAARLEQLASVAGDLKGGLLPINPLVAVPRGARQLTDRELMPPPPLPARISGATTGVVPSQSVPSNVGGFRDANGYRVIAPAPPRTTTPNGQEARAPNNNSTATATPAQRDINFTPVLPPLTNDWNTNQVIIRNWLHGMRDAGQSTVEARAALTMMGIRMEADAILERAAARQRLRARLRRPME